MRLKRPDDGGLYIHPLVSAWDWFQDPHGYQNPQMLKSLTVGPPYWCMQNPWIQRADYIQGAKERKGVLGLRSGKAIMRK